MVATKWLLARIMKLHVGKNGIAKVVTLKTSTGTYTQPVAKIVL